MKKSKIVIVVISLIAVAITGIAILWINKTNDYNSEISKVAENKTNEINENTEKNHNFWLAEYEFPKETKQLSQLYGNLITLPIKLTDFEGICDYFGYGYNKEANKISDIDAIIRREDSLTVKLLNYDNTWGEIPWFKIKNLTKEDKSVQECIENGWWYIDEIYVEKAFNIDMSKNDEYVPTKDEGALMEAIIEKIGAPTYVYLQKNSLEAMKEKDGTMSYSLVYEFEEGTIEISFYELILAEYNMYKSENAISYYYPKQYWENKKSEWDVVDTVEHNNIKLIIIK